MPSVPVDPQEAAAVAASCRRTFGDLRALPEPPGYRDLSLCLLHTVYGIRARPATVERVVAAYCADARIKPLPLRSGGREHTVRSLRNRLLELGPERFADEVVGNRQPTATQHGVLRSEALLRLTDILVGYGVTTRVQLEFVLPATEIEREWLEVPGQRSGLGWHWFLMLAGQQEVKGDAMIRGFVADAIRRQPAPDEAAALVAAAHRLLRKQVRGLDLRTLDHAIWSHQRAGRVTGAV